MPWTHPPTLEALSQAIDQVTPTLLLIYQQAYVAPLQTNLSHVLAAVLQPGNQTNEPAETMLGVVYGLAPGSEIAAPLRRFLAVVSNLYDSFLSDVRAISTLSGLNLASRISYSGIGQYLAGMTSSGAQQVTIQGLITQPDGTASFVDQTLPLPLMQYAAALVGRFIATAPTQALAGNSIQAIETWDDTDELTAQRNLAWFEGQLSGGPFGDVAQTLAGATLAALRAPEDYQAISQRLDGALDYLFKRDPVWGMPLPDFVALPSAAVDDLFGLHPSKFTR